MRKMYSYLFDYFVFYSNFETFKNLSLLFRCCLLSIVPIGIFAKGIHFEFILFYYLLFAFLSADSNVGLFSFWTFMETKNHSNEKFTENREHLTFNVCFSFLCNIVFCHSDSHHQRCHGCDKRYVTK